MITQMQNIEMKINLKNENVMENNMMMEDPNMMNIFESNNPMGNIIESSNENLNFEERNTIKYNITFIEQAGIKTLLVLDKETTIKEMIELYLNKIDKELDDIKGRPFLYKGRKLDINSKQSIKELFPQSVWIYSPF